MIELEVVLVGEKNRHGDNFLLLLIIPAITPANRSSLGVIHHHSPRSSRRYQWIAIKKKSGKNLRVFWRGSPEAMIVRYRFFRENARPNGQGREGTHVPHCLTSVSRKCLRVDPQTQ
jgi:hypothetical protein